MELPRGRLCAGRRQVDAQDAVGVIEHPCPDTSMKGQPVSQKSPERRPQDTAPTPSKTRRSYQKPKIVHLEALEAVAADCSVAGGKGDPTCIIGFS